MASAGWQRRNQLARARGYESYYDYRAHGYGARAPSAPRLSGEALRAARGHAGLRDLVDAIEAGSVELLVPLPTRRDDASGRITSVEVEVMDSRGRTRTYRLRESDLRGDRLRRLQAAMIGAGVEPYGNYAQLLTREAPDELEEAA